VALEVSEEEDLAEVVQVAVFEKKIKCPKCNIDMKKISKNNITLDKCQKCGGIWFDPGEMEKLNKVEVEKWQRKNQAKK